LADAAGALRSLAAPAAKKKIVGITSCPTGIAHTFMAAEGVEQGAKALGYDVKIETQGSVGSQNTLTAEEIAAADVVIIAADTNVDLSRFTGKRVFLSGTKPAIGDGKGLVAKALVEATVYGSAAKRDLADTVAAEKAARSANRTGPYKHLMTGVSYMLPFVVAGGILIALAFALGGIYVYDDAHAGTLGQALFLIGAKNAFALMVPILAGFIAYSIADRPGITPGAVGGMISGAIGAGFLGGIVAGFLAGYIVLFLNQHIKLHKNLEGLKPVLILPLLGTTIVGLLMIYVIGQPVATALAALTAFLKNMQGANAILLGAIIGLMMAFDMGGPVNKAAYTFATGLLASEIYAPMAAAMIAGMTPPLGVALATKMFRDRFSADEREAGNAAAVLGISFITEGAIPFAAKDPLRVIPSLMAGSAVAGMISMALGCEQRVPHGGIFVLPIPNAVTNLFGYLIALVVGTVITGVLLGFLKKPVAEA
jgi:PTS system fructose-specific IIC component